MLNTIKYIIICFLAIIVILKAQENGNELLNDQLIEMIEDLAENDNDIHFYNLIENLIENPLDLNKATQTDILKIPFISPDQAVLILNERKRRKGFNSVEDLYAIKTLHPDLIKLLRHLIVFSSNEAIPFELELRSRYLIDVQDRAGFTNSKFLGNKLKNYNRIKFQYEAIKLGFLTEKDAGEKVYFDHYTGFIEYKSKSFIEQLVLGDFNFEFGQGLILWSPYSFSKSIGATNSPIKRERGIIPHSSSDENKSFRGIAAKFNFGNILVNSYYSQNLLDASINDNNDVLSFYDIGYHRTSSELGKKNNLTSISIGTSLTYDNNKNISIGVLHYNNRFNRSFDVHSQYFNNNKNYNFSSLKFNFHIKDLLVYGEVATNYSSEAYLTNCHFSLTNNLSILFSYRNYSNNFSSFYSNGFGENGKTQNENGFYFGSKIKTTLGTFNLYYDVFKSPNKSFKSDFPSVGNDFLISFNTKLSGNLKFLMKIKRESKEILTVSINKRIFEYETKSTHRSEFKYHFGKSIFGKTRFEYVKYFLGSTIEEGKLFFQDIKYKLKKTLLITARIIFFKTQSYKSRIYEFENDLRGVMTNLPLFGEGIRWYFLFSYSPFESIKLHIKYSETYKPNVLSLGTGNSFINGGIDNRVSLQFDYNF